MDDYFSSPEVVEHSTHHTCSEMECHFGYFDYGSRIHWVDSELLDKNLMLHFVAIVTTDCSSSASTCRA